MTELETESLKPQMQELSQDSVVSQGSGAWARRPTAYSVPGAALPEQPWSHCWLLGLHRRNFRVIFKSTSRHLHSQIKCLTHDFAKVIVHYTTNYRGAPGARGLHGPLTSL